MKLFAIIVAVSFRCDAVVSSLAEEPSKDTPFWAKAFQTHTCTTTAKDAENKPCIWCDAMATIGRGVCVSINVKGMTGQYWDQFCKTTNSVPPPPPPGPLPTTPPPTPPPIPQPTPPAPVPNDIPDSLRCSMDATRNVITDKTKCTTEQKDASGSPCYWCNVPLLGGTCVTDSMKSTLGFMCQQQQQQQQQNNMATLFVQLVEKIDTTWNRFDPSCFGDLSIGLISNKDVCTARNDKNGKACVWWDAPGEYDDDKFGICATSDQREYVCNHMDCDNAQQMEENLDTTVADTVVSAE